MSTNTYSQMKLSEAQSMAKEHERG